MTPRADLLELSAEALTALSNAGFVKRAQKDVAEGKLPVIEQMADGTVSATYSDGTVTTLAPAKPLRQAICSCPATGLCRHRVTLVLAYQAHAGADATPDAVASAWCPSQFAEAVLALPRATLEQARRLAASHPVIRLAAAEPPAARLPMCDVRFLSRTSLALARCDCQQGENCAHVALAVWAFAQGQRRQPGFDSMTIELELPTTEGASPAAARAPDPAAEQAQAFIFALANRLWLDGTSQNPLALEAPFEQAFQAAERQGWSWVAEGLNQLRLGIAGQHARSSGADPARLLHLLTTLVARLLAARSASIEGALPAIPARQILGIGVKGEVALDHLRLVPLGSSCWSDDSADGVRMIWADPDTQAVTVLEKRWPSMAALAAPAPPASPIRQRRLLGMPLHRLGASQIVTKAAKRRANGMITIGATASQSTVLPLTSAAWDNLAAPLRQPNLPALRAYLRGLPPDFVRPLQAIEHVHVLPLNAVIDCTWDGAGQTLNAHVLVGDEGCEDEAPNTLQLRLRHDPAAPAAIDALAAALAGEHGVPLAIAGGVTARAGNFCMTPFAVLTTQGLIVPQLAAESAARVLPGTEAMATDGLNALLDRTADLLAQCLRQGLRHQGRSAIERAQEQASALRAAGLFRCADAFIAAFDAVKDGDGELLGSKMAALHSLLELLAFEALI